MRSICSAQSQRVSLRVSPPLNLSTTDAWRLATFRIVFVRPIGCSILHDDLMLPSAMTAAPWGAGRGKDRKMLRVGQIEGAKTVWVREYLRFGTENGRLFAPTSADHPAKDGAIISRQR